MLVEVKKRRIRRQYASYKGDGFACNYCGSCYSKFAPWHPDPKDRLALEKNQVIAGYGQNVYCPYCMSTGRERLVIAKLSGMDISGKNILHLAPEEKIFKIIKPRATVTTADIEPGFYSYLDPVIQHADLTRLPYPEASFNMVIGNHIMEHIPDDQAAMREIYRVLKPNGTAILQIPFSSINSSTIEDCSIQDADKQSGLFGQKDHIRIYSLKDYINRLGKAGFTVVYEPYESLSDLYKYAIQPAEGFLSIIKK